MEIYHLKWTSCSGLSFKFVFHYLFGNIAGGQLHWQPHRPQDSEGPLRARFEAVVPENGHEEAAFLHAPFCLRGQQAPSWKSSVLGCKLEWNVPGDTPKGLFFVTSPRFSFLPRIILMPSICSAVGAFVCGAGTERKLAGCGNSATTRRGDQVTFQTSSTPEYRAIWGCRKFDSAEAGPGLIWILWFHL